MMHAFLMLGVTLPGGLVRLMQALRLSVPLPVWGTGSYRVSSMVSGSHHAGGWYFLRTGGTCSIVLGGVPDLWRGKWSCDDKVWQDCQTLLLDDFAKK